MIVAGFELPLLGIGINPRRLVAPAAGLTITVAAGSVTFALANDLAAVEALGTTGIVARTALNTWTTRTITAPAAGITIAAGDGVAGNPTLSLANDLLAVENLAGTGVAVRTGASTWTNRTLTGTANKITVTDGDGVAGNPTLTIAVTYAGQASIVTLGTVTTGTWNAGAVSSSFDSLATCPASTTTAGWSITSNYDGDSKVNFWNTVDASLNGFIFKQKTGAAAHLDLAAIYGDATFSKIAVYGPAGTGVLYVDAAETATGSISNIPFSIYTHNILAATFDTSQRLELFGNFMKLASVAFATLPAAGTFGRVACVNNSTTNVWGATITGGGANKVLAMDNGTNWTVVGK